MVGRGRREGASIIAQNYLISNAVEKQFKTTFVVAQ
jgi:hypothetical protein